MLSEAKSPYAASLDKAHLKSFMKRGLPTLNEPVKMDARVPKKKPTGTLPSRPSGGRMSLHSSQVDYSALQRPSIAMPQLEQPHPLLSPPPTSARLVSGARRRRVPRLPPRRHPPPLSPSPCGPDPEERVAVACFLRGFYCTWDLRFLVLLEEAWARSIDLFCTHHRHGHDPKTRRAPQPHERERGLLHVAPRFPRPKICFKCDKSVDQFHIDDTRNERNPY
ncbi:hypothetical protein B0H14DRAFT_3656364 [Mycena olivaceomarginata]|nr:hypothetical protein B0H14DRAFT_3656364 [Mycena olivaceomarginata]